MRTSRQRKDLYSRRPKANKSLGLFSLCLILLLFFSSVFPVNLLFLKEQVKAETLEGQAEDLEVQVEDLEGQVEDLEGQVEDLEALAEDLEAQVDAQEEVPNFSELLADVPRPEDAWPKLEEIGAAAYIVMDADTGEILLELNSEDVAYPASMTKIMTAIVVLEHPEYSPDRPVYFSETATLMPAPESATAGLLPGEIAPTISCLYMMMVRSANEIANALAENYGGSIEGFANMMNDKAREIGCENTHFVDPTGFGYVDHYTTAQDMAKIIQYAMRNPLFQSLASAKYYSMPPTNLHPMSAWSNHFNGNYLVVFQDSGFQSPWLKSIDGVKPGHTDLAGSCLATAATTYDGRHLIAVIFKSHYLGLSNSFVGVASMSRTLLEEGAKALGSPRKDDTEEREDAYYAWPSMQDPYLARHTEVETTPPTFVVPTFNVEQANTVGENQVLISRLQLALLISFLSIFLLTALVLAYVLYHRKRQDKIMRRYDDLED